MKEIDIKYHFRPADILVFPVRNIHRSNGRGAINTPLNLLLTIVALGGTLFQLFGMPYALHAFGFHACWLLIPITLLQPLQWGLIHESIHSHLLPNRKADRFSSRLLSVSIGVPFDITRFSHLVHHRFSRHGYDRADVYDGHGPYALAWLRYWARLFGGVYLGIIFSPLLAFLPMTMGVRLMEKLIPINEEGDLFVRKLFTSVARNASKRQRMRQDFTMAFILYAASAWTYGEWWPVLLATMYVRGLWHSLADNVAHHDVELDEPERARNFTLPGFFRLLVLNQHLHMTHHLYPNTPWTMLDKISVPKTKKQTANYFRAVLRQLKPGYPIISEKQKAIKPLKHGSGHC